MSRPTRREVVLEALRFRPPPYVPWAWDPTQPMADRLRAHLGADDLGPFLDSHFLDLGEDVGRFEALGGGLWRDVYGVVWDRRVDKDIGVPVDWPLKRPEDLARYTWPDVTRDDLFADLPGRLAARPDLFSRYRLGFSLYERAWTMRGLEPLLMDMVERPEFVERLLDAITEHDLGEVRRALALGVDAVYFGDDYGMQTGLLMGLAHWRHFFRPRLARLFAPVREAGRYVFLHSCGRVTDLFDDLVGIGLSCFNPFQPEVMDVAALLPRYRGRLAFHGGLSTQRTLPFGTVEDVRAETRRLLELGRDGGYLFAPAHDIEGDVPLENILAFVEILHRQPGYRRGDST